MKSLMYSIGALVVFSISMVWAFGFGMYDRAAYAVGIAVIFELWSRE